LLLVEPRDVDAAERDRVCPEPKVLRHLQSHKIMCLMVGT
jgi:hypothetical protein